MVPPLMAENMEISDAISILKCARSVSELRRMMFSVLDASLPGHAISVCIYDEEIVDEYGVTQSGKWGCEGAPVGDGSGRIRIPIEYDRNKVGEISIDPRPGDVLASREDAFLKSVAEVGSLVLAGLLSERFLSQTVRRYQAIVEDQTELICRFLADGTLTYVNPAYCRYFMRSEDELVGHKFLPMVPEGDHVLIKEAMARISPSEPVVTYEHRIVLDDGRIRWQQWTDRALFSRDGMVREYQSVGRDITDFHQTQEIVRIERDLVTLLAQTADCSEAIGSIISAALELDGVECGGVYLVEPETGDLVLLEHRGLSDEFVQQVGRYPKGSVNYMAVAEGQARYDLHRNLMDDGERRMVLVAEGLQALGVVPVMADGRLIAVLNVGSRSRDVFSVTTRHALETLAVHIGVHLNRIEAEEDLRNSREDLKNLFDSIDDFLFVLDDQGTILRTNPATLKRFCYTEDEIVGMNVLEVHPEGRREEALDIVMKMLAGTERWCHVPVITKAGEPIPVETKVTAGRWGGKPAMFGITRDVTERVDAEMALRDSEDRFRQIADNIQDVFFLATTEPLEVIYANPAGEEIMGPAKSGFPCPMSDFLSAIHPEDFSEKKAEIRSHFSICHPAELSFRVISNAGDVRWVRSRTFRVFGIGETENRIAGIIQDVTLEYHAKSVLESARSRLEERVNERTRELTDINRQLKIAVAEHKAVERELCRHRGKLREMTPELDQVAETERRKIASMIHDDLGQSISLATIRVEMLSRACPENPSAGELQSISGLLEKVIAQAHHLTAPLAPPILHELGLGPAIEWYLDDFAPPHNLVWDVSISEVIGFIPGDVRVVLFRNTRELLVNIVKHAQAGRVCVRLLNVKGGLKVPVEDDGIGFDKNRVREMNTGTFGFGLFSVRERLHAFGGTLRIGTRPGGGSRVTQFVPGIMAME